MVEASAIASESEMPQVQERWNTFCGLVDGKREAVFALIEASYARNGYHTLVHIQECLALFDELRELAHDPRALEMAIWFHDIVCVPGRGDNEQLSALVARMACRELGMEPLADAVERLILATRHDTPPAPGDEALMVDIDLSVLGSDPDRYDAYAAQIRAEYSSIDESTFRAGRAEVLRRLLAREHLYLTPTLRQRLETGARANMQRELNSLVPSQHK
jgi:predicted metal-dependent HD superfamily phosphohydrolase